MDGVTELPMKAGTNMKIAGKTVYFFVLLLITLVMTLAGESYWDQLAIGK